MQGKKFSQKMALFKKKMNDDVKYLNDLKIELDLLRSQQHSVTKLNDPLRE